MKKKIADRLRAWAEKLDPSPVVVFPPSEKIQYNGETYKPVELKARQYIPPYVQGEVTEEATWAVKQSLENKAAPYIDVKRVENYDEVYVEGKIFVLLKQD